MAQLSFALIGDGSLLVRCAEEILEREMRIVAIVSDDEGVVSWAGERNVPRVPRSALVEGLGEASPFDYLLSIANLSITPARVLKFARRMAINFHDGPLPRYAGLNAPVWALLAGERTHGVTWHVMEAGADTGPILRQALFDVLESDTAMTLNARCFAAGLESFSHLLDDLVADDVRPRPQDLGQREFFRAARRPQGYAVLDFSEGADRVVRTVRALDFGHYSNPVAVAKLRTSDGTFAVGEATACESSSEAAPGTIVAVNGSEVRVSTPDRDVLLTAVAPIFGAGSPVAGSVAVGAAGARDIAEGLARHEAHWAQILGEPRPLRTPTVVPLDRVAGNGIPGTEVEASFQSEASEVAAGVALFLGRRAGVSEFHVGFTHRELLEAIDRHEDVFSPVVPVPVSFEAEATFEDALASARSALEAAMRAGTFPRDLTLRRQELRQDGLADAGVVIALDAAPAAADVALLVCVDSPAAVVTWTSPSGALSPAALATLRDEYRTFLDAAAETPSAPCVRLPILPPVTREHVLRGWNATARSFAPSPLHESIERVCANDPGATAVVCEGAKLTYAQLNDRANRLARHLRAAGVSPGDVVGIALPRSVDLVVSLFAIHKAGAAYLPLDPEYPEERLVFMLNDSGARVVVAAGELQFSVPSGVRVVRLSSDREEIARHSGSNLDLPVPSGALAYVIYTSGSTGRPKGVMIEHRNVQNFFVGMDDVLGTERGTWLNVTSPSFDISVLELLWTLARGFTVVIYTGGAAALLPSHAERTESQLGLSLFFFGTDDVNSADDPYALVLDAARFADEHGFEAVWTPERHFHAFGGAFPNPSVLASALAVATRNVSIRAGSCVLPLHHPIRVAEEWAVVDRLSGGRAGVSFAAGWQPEDFVLNPGNFATARADLLEHIETVRRLWNGKATAFPGPDGGTVAVQTHPRPVQDELPIWLTSAGSEATFRQAGELGANVLTHLLGQSLEDVERLVGVYRRARRDAGHQGPGKVTLMLHTFVGETDEEVRSAVREPMIRYLRSSVGLIRDFASSFPAFRNRAQPIDAAGDLLSGLSAEELRDLLEHAFERYYRTSGLFGTPERCAEILRAVRRVGVDEVACLVDFGLPAREVLGGLARLNQARGRLDGGGGEQTSVAGLIREHGVTHFQCTPSMMSVLAGHDETLAALRRLRVTLVGGEAFPLPLAQRLSAELPGRLLNMYGPTETTIWSTVHEVREGESSVPIGRPIANTACYVLDEHRQPTPPGMIGELYIGGDGVARGYLNRPELTAQRFVTDPFAAPPDARMYRTGDLARFRADGVLEFHGRIDGQVKIRGHRIELGEIETAIGQQSGVRDVVVVALDDQRGEATLAAYCSPSDGRHLDTATIRAALARKLPQVMIPSFIVTMDTLPKTPNGKFDRKALPRPETVSEASAIVERPAGALEEEIAAIWREELGIPEVSRSTSFFDLGGNSLLLVKVHRRLCEGRRARLSLADLFHYPTVAALAAHLADEPVITSAGVARAAARRSALTRRREPAPVGTTQS